MLMLLLSLLTLITISFEPALTTFFPEKGTLNKFDRKMVHIVSENGISTENLDPLPIEPETTERLFHDSDVIAYAAIIHVDKRIRNRERSRMKFLAPGIFPEQSCEVSLLWILKGESSLQGKTISIIKKRSRYYLAENEKRVLYLKMQDRHFQTVDKFGGEHRLASALCDIKNLETGARSGGIVASFRVDDSSLCPKIHLLRGRHRMSLKKNDKIWREFLIKPEKISRFNICEIPLERGLYTVLVEIEDHLYSYTRPVDGYYACVMVGNHRWWEPLYFGF